MSTATSTVRPVLVAGQWRDADYQTTFQATDPNKNRKAAGRVSGQLLGGLRRGPRCSGRSSRELCDVCRPAKIAEFLERYADRIDAAKDALVEAAFAETGLARARVWPMSNCPRTSNQLRAAAAACRSGNWALPTIDTNCGHSIVLRSHSVRFACLAPTTFRSHLAVSREVTSRPRSPPATP